MLAQVHAGVGRARRGEVLSGSTLVRGEAVDHFVRATTARMDDAEDRLDPLDPRRRFDMVFTTIAARLETVVRLPVEDAGRQLVALAEETLAPAWTDFPHAAIAAIRDHFAWS
jgi:hypothetical protein